jgi:hypothetical protein
MIKKVYIILICIFLAVLSWFVYMGIGKDRDVEDIIVKDPNPVKIVSPYVLVVPDDRASPGKGEMVHIMLDYPMAMKENNTVPPTDIILTVYGPRSGAAGGGEPLDKELFKQTYPTPEPGVRSENKYGVWDMEFFYDGATAEPNYSGTGRAFLLGQFRVKIDLLNKKTNMVYATASGEDFFSKARVYNEAEGGPLLIPGNATVKVFYLKKGAKLGMVPSSGDIGTEQFAYPGSDEEITQMLGAGNIADIKIYANREPGARPVPKELLTSCAYALVSYDGVETLPDGVKVSGTALGPYSFYEYFVSGDAC